MANISDEVQKISSLIGVRTAYGDAQEVDGIPVVPVAVTWGAFGVGQDETSNAGGGGGAAAAVPIGVYTRVGDDVRFRPNIVTLLIAAVPFVWVSGRVITRIIRALKR